MLFTNWLTALTTRRSRRGTRRSRWQPPLLTRHFATPSLASSSETLEERTLLSAGQLDGTFGTGGLVSTDFGSSEDGQAIAFDSNGKIVVAGWVSNGGNTDFAVARYNADGSLDTSFDSDGKVTTDFGGSDDQAFGVAIDSSGRIVVAGYTYNGSNYDFAMTRYNSNGSLDTTFDGDGKLTTAIGSSDDFAEDVTIDSNGKIVVVGITDNGSHYDFALVRYNSDGSLDASFDSDGVVTTDFNGSVDRAESLTVDSSGKIVAVGNAFTGSTYDFAVARYNTDGSLDTSFDTDGKQTTAFGSSYDYAEGVAIDSNGKIVVAGRTQNSTYDFAIARYNTNGSLDTTFDTDGKQTTDFSGTNDDGYGMAIDANGKIVVGGATNSGNQFALARYNTDGSLDTTFDTDGKQTTAFTNFALARDMAIDGSGRIVLAGVTSNGTNTDFALARYQGDAVASSVNLSVTANSGTEAGTTVITVTLTADAPVSGDQTVNLAVSGTGITTDDYTLTDGDTGLSGIQIKILSGQTTGAVTLTITDDLLNEGSETATLTISNPSSGIVLGTTTSQDVTITDNDTADSATVTQPANGAADSVKLVINSGNLELRTVPGDVLLSSRSLSSLGNGVTIQGANGEDDTLTLDFGGGNLVPAGGLVFLGGTGGHDSLIVTGGTTTSVTHAFTNANNGSITLIGSLAGTITYTGLEPITDNLSATDRVFTFSGGDDAITLADATGAAMTIDSNLAESVTFANPTNSLTINAGDGTDTVTVNSTDSAFRASLTVNGDVGTDAITLSANLSLGNGAVTGSLSLNGETINLNSSTIATDQGTNAGSVTLTGAVVLGTNVAIDVDAASGSDNNLTVTGSINADAAANNRTLQLTSGGGTLNLSGASIGASQALQSLTTSSTVQSLFNSIQTRDGGVSISAGGSPAVILGGSINTDAGTNAGGVTITGSVDLDANVTIDTNHASGTDGNVSITGAVNAKLVGDNRTLTLDADAGTVSFGGNIGSSRALQTLTVTSAASATFNNITTRSGGISVTAMTINLNGNVNTDSLTTSGPATFNGAVSLGANVSIDTDNTGTDGSLSFNGTISGANGLNVNAGGGTAQFVSAVGSPTRLTDFDVTAATIRLPNDVLTDGGSLTFVGNVVLNLAGQLTIDTERLDDSNAGSVTFSGGSISASAADRDLVINTTTGGTNTSGNISLSTVDSNAGFALRNLTLNAARATTPGTGALADVTLAGAITLASNGNLDIDAQTVTLSTPSSDVAISGTGTIRIDVSRNVALSSSSSLSAVNGNITVNANQQATATMGNFIGIDVNAAEIKTTGSGAVNLTGRGGTIGVAVRSAGNVSATGGSVTIAGTGNDGAIDGNMGVYLLGAATVTSTTGAMSITGTGGVTIGQANDGIRIESGSRVDSTGGATVTLNGTGRGADNGGNYGVRITGTNSKITSNGGDILVTGIGATVTHSGNVGVALTDGQINATGSAKITVNGTGGIAADNNLGLLISGTNGGVTSIVFGTSFAQEKFKCRVLRDG